MTSEPTFEQLLRGRFFYGNKLFSYVLYSEINKVSSVCYLGYFCGMGMKTIVKIALLVYCLGMGGVGVLGKVLYSMEVPKIERMAIYEHTTNFAWMPVRPPYPRQR